MYLAITWGGAIWYKTSKKPKDFSWGLVAGAPILAFSIIPILLATATFYNFSRTVQSPFTYLLFALTQCAFVIPTMPDSINGPLGADDVPDAVAITWSHSGQYALVAVSVVLFLLMWQLKRQQKMNKAYQTPFHVAALIFAICGLLLIDIVLAQAAVSWWTIAVTIGSFIVGVFIEEFRRRHHSTSEALP